MNFTTYVNAIESTFKQVETPWHYLPSTCQNHVCCSDNNEPTIHGIVLLTSQYEPIIICEDCAFQIKNKNYSIKYKHLKKKQT